MLSTILKWQNLINYANGFISCILSFRQQKKEIMNISKDRK
jgi:hypothetical protein